MRNVTGCIVVIAVIAGAIKSYTFPETKFNATAFNAAVLKTDKPLSQAYADFVKHALLAADGGRHDLKGHQKQVIVLQEKALADLSALQAPESKSAQDFLQAYKSLNTKRAEVVLLTMDDVIQMVENGSLTPADMKARINQLWGHVEQTERRHLEAVTAAQQEFARSHSFTVKKAQAF